MGQRGKKKPSQRALAVCELQDKLPDSRVIYASATGATEVANLGYAQRLGIWGPGTAFPNKIEFITSIEGSGLAAMELVARDLKQEGLYLSRGLSFEGVEYDRHDCFHVLTSDQREMYDLLCEAWQIALANIEQALKVTSGGEKVDGKRRGAAMSAFWGAHQRFFNCLLCALSLPTVLKDVEREIAAGNCAVLQLVNTNEASMERALGKLTEEDDLSDMDTTPRDQLIQLIEKCFPVIQHEEYLDASSNSLRQRPCTDKDGNPIFSREALEMKEQLKDRVSCVRCPEGPLEMLLNYFGDKRVAEVTGRGRRVIRITEDGIEKTVIQNRNKSIRMAEAYDFQDGRRDILVFSDAGGTGASYHADTTRANQKRRIHYLIQPGWVADQAVQGFGRTHRSRQACAPLYKLVSTDLKGQKRFISTIARRLDQLGALTKGQRQAAAQGIFDAADNLESKWAKQALMKFYHDLYEKKIEQISLSDFEKQTGLRLLTKDGVLRDDPPPITQWLNRLLSLRINLQNVVFDIYNDRLVEIVHKAEEEGVLDVGVETIRADKVEKLSEQEVYKHPGSGATTLLCEFKLSKRSAPASFDEVMEQRHATRNQKIEFFARNNRSGHVYAFTLAGDRQQANGSVVPSYYEIGPNSRRVIPQRDLRATDYDSKTYKNIDRWLRLEVGDENHMQLARRLWDAQFAAVPEFSEKKLLLLCGICLPIWDRLPKGNTRVNRIQTTAGERFLGRVIEETELDDTLKRLGCELEAESFNAERVIAFLDAGTHYLSLSNGWKLHRKRVAGEHRYELDGPDWKHLKDIERIGGWMERIQFKARWFIPTGPKAMESITKLIADKPVLAATRIERSEAA